MGKCEYLKISQDKRFIIKTDGSPFFWLGDTAWELFHRLNREEAVEYLSARASQKFSVIQAVALAEFEGLNIMNAYGRVPLLTDKDGNYAPEMPDLEILPDSNYTYWDHVDFIVDTADSLGLYIGLLPTWGDKFNKKWGKGPEIFTPENAYIYGKWIGERYKNRSNIIWIMGGDRPIDTDTHRLIVRKMAEGIKETTDNKHLMTYHPTGFSSSSGHVHNEPWLDFNMIQSGHGGLNIKNYEFIQKDRELSPVKPTLDGEPRYEDHPVNFNAENGYFDGYDVRVAAYWAMLSGALGHTYGHHCIWSFNNEKKDYYIMNWRTAIHRPGAEDMTHLADLLMSRNLLELTPCQELLHANYGGANYISAAKGEKYAYMYTPNGLDIKVNMGILKSGEVAAQWFDPCNGTYIFEGLIKNEGVITFVPPSSGRNDDWVLVLGVM